jgi:hypothetical protein
MTRRSVFITLATLVTGLLSRRADAGTIQLRGTLFASSDDKGNLSFFTDPEEDSESIQLLPSAGGFVESWLKGSVGGRAVITMEVIKEKR